MTNDVNSKPKLLIHIGYHKTASTFWQENVFSGKSINMVDRQSVQNNILMPSPYEFNAEALNNWLKSWCTDDQLNVISDEELSGNIHTSGGGRSITYEVIERLATITGMDVIVLIFIRNQQAMIESCYRQYIKKGGCFSFKNYIRSSEKGSLRYRFPGFSFEHFKYDDVIEHCISKFGKDKVNVIPYETFKQSPENVINQLSDVVGTQLTIRDNNTNTIKNRSYSNLSVLMARVTNRFFNHDPICRHSLFGLNRLYYVLRKMYMTLDGLLPKRLVYRSYISDELATELSETYKTSNQRTTEMTGLDLKSLKYFI